MDRAKKVLLLGARGMLGHVLTERLSQNSKIELRSTARSTKGLDQVLRKKALDSVIADIDVRDFKKLRLVLEEYKPDWIVNCLGIIKQLPEAQDAALSFEMNTLFPHRLSEVAFSIGARVLQISTDCVFSGKTGFYKENDPSDVNDIYGVSKHLGELYYPQTLTLRSSIIGFEVGSSHGLLEWFLSQKGGSVKGYRRAIYSGLTTLELTRVIEILLMDKSPLKGLWNVASKPLSKFDLLKLINEKMNVGVQIIPDDTVICDRGLDGTAFANAASYRAPSWDKMIEELASTYVKRL